MDVQGVGISGGGGRDGGYAGVLTSPLYGQPSLVMNPRKVDLGVNLSF